MKKHIHLVALCLILGMGALKAQNVMINVLTLNSGVVKIGETVLFEVSINNTSTFRVTPAYTLKPQISFPNKVVEVLDTGHILPSGWTILTNGDGVVTLSNGKDVIAENDGRTILIAIKGKTISGPATIIGDLKFSNGVAPGSMIGKALPDDDYSDNSASSTVTVIK
jgi:hypothetical protein